MRFAPPPDWTAGRPPREWKRIMACDVGGATPWAFEIAALDPWSNIVFYGEVYRATTDVDWLADQMKPKLLDPAGEPYTWIAKVIDYANKLAADDLARRGILFTNAQKMGKAASIQRLSGYLHPNPRHHFPPWHPQAGQPNAPRMFVTTGCPNLIREIPQQRWKEAIGEDGRLKNEADRTVENHAWDCLDGTTAVLTPEGICSIQALPCHGIVMGPRGWTVYSGVRQTRQHSPMVEVVFRDGRSAKTTLDHKFLTPDGWIPADSLMDCICYTNDIWKNRFLKESSTTGIETNDILAGERSACIESFGSGITAGFFLDFMSITRTAIRRITRSAISNWLSGRFIFPSMARFQLRGAGNTWMMYGLWLPHGTVVPQAGNGMWSTAPDPLSSGGESESNSVAHRAGSPLWVGLECREPSGYVHQGAEPPSGGLAEKITNHVSASGAMTYSKQTVTPSYGAVRCIAVNPAGYADTYCLQTENTDHSFTVQGGLIVHNCVLYVLRELPDPVMLPALAAPTAGNTLSKQSECYYELARQHEREVAMAANHRGVRRVILPTW